MVLGDEGAFAGMKRGAVFVDHTTASAEVARELAAAAQRAASHFIDAPVSGGKLGALNGALTVMCGGDAAAFDDIQPVAMAFAKAMTLLGPSGAGQLAKMVNQIAIAGLVQGLAEAIAFGQKAGLDMKAVLEVIGKGAAQSWQMDNRGPTMIDGKFDFGFAVDWMRKDLGLVLEEARRNGARLPVTALVDQFYADMQAAGRQPLGHLEPDQAPAARRREARGRHWRDARWPRWRAWRAPRLRVRQLGFGQDLEHPHHLLTRRSTPRATSVARSASRSVTRPIR